MWRSRARVGNMFSFLPAVLLLLVLLREESARHISSLRNDGHTSLMTVRSIGGLARLKTLHIWRNLITLFSVPSSRLPSSSFHFYSFHHQARPGMVSCFERAPILTRQNVLRTSTAGFTCLQMQAIAVPSDIATPVTSYTLAAGQLSCTLSFR